MIAWCACHSKGVCFQATSHRARRCNALLQQGQRMQGRTHCMHWYCVRSAAVWAVAASLVAHCMQPRPRVTQASTYTPHRLHVHTHSTKATGLLLSSTAPQCAGECCAGLGAGQAHGSSWLQVRCQHKGPQHGCRHTVLGGTRRL